MQAPLAPEDLEACSGFYRVSRLLHATAEAGIAPLLSHGPRRAEDLAFHTASDTRTLRAFLDALCAWGVFARDGQGRYALTPFSERLLPGGAGSANAALIAGWSGNDAVIHAFAGLRHTLRTGECGLRGSHGTDFHGYLARNAEAAASYNEAMESTTDSFDACVDALQLPREGCAVDIGGGQGGFLQALLRRHPGWRGICVDLPHVIEHAPREHAFQGRLAFVGADAMSGLPRGADLYLTSTVLRCFDDAAARLLLVRVREAMTSRHARVTCFEMVLPADRDDPMLALADVTARVVYGGQDRTQGEFESLFARAGLALESCSPVQGALHVLQAQRVD